MSWGIARAGHGPQVAMAVNADVASHGKYSPTTESMEILEALRRVIELFAKQYPEKTIVVESSGHLDHHGGAFTLSGRVFQP